MAFLGLVGMNIRLESLSNTLSEIVSEHQAEEGLQLAILDSSAQIIAYPDPRPAPAPRQRPDPGYLPEGAGGQSGTSLPRT
jgi:hypothetical protein